MPRPHLSGRKRCGEPSRMDHFPVTSSIRGSLIYTMDRAWGGATHAVQCITFYGENPASARIPACKPRLGIATHEGIALFVEQRERFHLPFVATSCDLPSPRYACWKSLFGGSTEIFASNSEKSGSGHESRGRKRDGWVWSRRLCVRTCRYRQRARAQIWW